MNYVRRLANTTFGQALLKSCLIMSCVWGIFGLIHALLSLLFLTPITWLCLFLATVAWGTHINYTYELDVEQDDNGFRFVYKPGSKEEGEK